MVGMAFVAWLGFNMRDQWEFSGSGSEFRGRAYGEQDAMVFMSESVQLRRIPFQAHICFTTSSFWKISRDGTCD